MSSRNSRFSRAARRYAESHRPDRWPAFCALCSTRTPTAGFDLSPPAQGVRQFFLCGFCIDVLPSMMKLYSAEGLLNVIRQHLAHDVRCLRQSD